MNCRNNHHHHNNYYCSNHRDDVIKAAFLHRGIRVEQIYTRRFEL